MVGCKSGQNGREAACNSNSGWNISLVKGAVLQSAILAHGVRYLAAVTLHMNEKLVPGWQTWSGSGCTGVYPAVTCPVGDSVTGAKLSVLMMCSKMAAQIGNTACSKAHSTDIHAVPVSALAPLDLRQWGTSGAVCRMHWIRAKTSCRWLQSSLRKKSSGCNNCSRLWMRRSRPMAKV